ncbi:hypothetical protein DNTS_005533 [Danionella cerebrum]|uniref:Uncharacterized protein n=1 Tax=Danionella cerebrum TaxID=2873325 RepID=A0A553NJR6_9TELE|nr:hypothetical protein DNTS_005533 [Danionella translucida]
MDAEDARTDKTTVKNQTEAVMSNLQKDEDDRRNEEEQRQIPEDHYYNYEDLKSKAFISEASEISYTLLELSHSFGYESGRRANLQLLDETTLLFIAGDILILLDVRTKEQRYLRSCSGGGLGAITVHPSRQFFAVAEKDYTLSLWDWRAEQATLRKKAFSQDVYGVSFSPENVGQLTTSGSGHIRGGKVKDTIFRFWRMASTFTGLKLEGLIGSFGKTTVTDIHGYVELPDGKVVSGSDWGNLLLWDGGLIKVEISRRSGRPCHNGVIRQLHLEEEELISIGTDGAVRIEPMNEMLIGRGVSLLSMVRSPDASIWFAQDSSGCIWKLDLSFSNITQDPECVSSFHAGVVQGLDVCESAHLMATTAPDVFDFELKKELTVCRFKQGGTALTWTSDGISAALLAVGFEDGVVRLLELYDPHGLLSPLSHPRSREAELRLRQALKPHDAPVTAVAFSSSGSIMATAGADGSVFFFMVGEVYHPLGFVSVPGPVRALQWSPPSHERSTLLVLCVNGHVLELESPHPDFQSDVNTFQLSSLPTIHFCFHSIKSRIKRQEAIALRAAREEERRKRREERLTKLKQQKREAAEEELKEELDKPEEEVEEEEELPSLYVPSPSSPVHCGFYSGPGTFWLSVVYTYSTIYSKQVSLAPLTLFEFQGGFDSGFLYHCRFSQDQTCDPRERKDEPFAYIRIQDAEQNAITSISFSSSGSLMLCGMEDGSLRLYPISSSDPELVSMSSYWSMSFHDNQNGSIKHTHFSFDDMYVLSAGDDGNIFCFHCASAKRETASSQTAIPLPRVGLEKEKAVLDIEDPSAYSIETAKQKLELDRMRAEAEERKQQRRKNLTELQRRFQGLLNQNQKLPEHVRLHRSEFEMDRRFSEELEKLTEHRVREVRKELAYEEERERIGLAKLHSMFQASVTQESLSVCAFLSDHEVCSYTQVTPPFTQTHMCSHNSPEELVLPMEVKRISSSQSLVEELESDALELAPQVESSSKKLGSRETEKLRKINERADRNRALIKKRKEEWAELYASKPSEDFEDPRDVSSIQKARETLGDFKLKTAEDYTVPQNMRMNDERKRAQMEQLERQLFQQKAEMNRRVQALRQRKLDILSILQSHAEQIRVLQKALPPTKRRSVPKVPVLMPQEMPEKKHRFTRATLERFSRLCSEGKEDQNILDLLQEQEPDTYSDMPEENTLHVTLFEELLLLKDFEKREERLQERLHTYRKEEDEITARALELRRQQDHRRREIQRLQLKEKSIFQSFQSSLGENQNQRFQELLSRLFRKKVKRSRKKEAQREPGGDVTEDEEDSDEDSNEESDAEDEEDYEESETGAPLDDSVCPPNCDPALYQNTLHLRDLRLDVEEQLQEENKTLEALRKENDTLGKKEKMVQSNRRSAEFDLELLDREKQQRLNEVHVVLPLRLHQLECEEESLSAASLDTALVLNSADLQRLQKRIRDLYQEKQEQRELYKQNRHTHVQLRHELSDMMNTIREWEVRCEQLMMMKFGKLVDLEALQTLSGNRKLEEMKQEVRERDGRFTQELRQWEARVSGAREALTEATRLNTERLEKINALLREKKALDNTLDALQKKTVGQYQACSVDHQELHDLRCLVSAQNREIEDLRREIHMLSRKDTHILPPITHAYS